MKPFLLLIHSLIFFSISCTQDATQTYEYIIYTKPATSITIDGDLSDWSPDIVAIPIQNKLWGEDAKGLTDIHASFRTAYNPLSQVLYIAVSITDDIHEDQKDTYTLYLDEQHHRAGSGIAEFNFKGNQLETPDITHSWDPEIASYQDQDKISFSYSNSDTSSVYEIAIRLEEPITAGQVFRIGHQILDSDRDSETVLGWVPRGGKSETAQPERIGALVFQDSTLQKGMISGRVSWKDRSYTTRPEGVYAVHSEFPSRWFYLPLDEQGMYSAELPSGKYQLKPGKLAFFSGDEFHQADSSIVQTISVQADKKSTAAIYYLKAVEKPEFQSAGNLLFEFDESSPAKIDSFIQKHLDYYQIEGASFAAMKDGEIIYAQQYGVSNNYTKEAVNEQTLFEFASITKPVFAFAVLRLWEKGIIDLDTPLYKTLEFDLIKDQPYSKLITARHVLTHQTGFPNWAWDGNLEFEFEPGTDIGYSGEAFEYLKRVITKITGKDLYQILQEEVVEPLGLEHFYIQGHPYAWNNKSHGHYNGFPGNVGFFDPPLAAASLVTTPVSFLRFAEAIHKREGLKPETYEMMLSNYGSMPDELQEGNFGSKEHMGLGWFIEDAPYGRVIRHSGNNGNFEAMFRLYDPYGIAYVLTVNGNSGFFLINQLEKILIDPELVK